MIRKNFCINFSDNLRDILFKCGLGMQMRLEASIDSGKIQRKFILKYALLDSLENNK